jgi:hypothetical protein
MTEFIEGTRLLHGVFPSLPISVQDTICAKVSSQLRYLRELPSEGYYGRVYKQGWTSAPPGIDTCTYTSQAIIKPYETYEEFVSALFRAEQNNMSIRYNIPEWDPKELERNAEFMATFPSWEPHEPKFTWIDPKMSNMIAQKITKDDGSEDWEVFLMDWECCGWLPAWTQGVQVKSRSGELVSDPTDKYNISHYRKSEITPMIMKDFDPDFDEERMVPLHANDWMFY